MFSIGGFNSRYLVKGDHCNTLVFFNEKGESFKIVFENEMFVIQSLIQGKKVQNEWKKYKAQFIDIAEDQSQYIIFNHLNQFKQEYGYFTQVCYSEGKVTYQEKNQQINFLKACNNLVFFQFPKQILIFEINLKRTQKNPNNDNQKKLIQIDYGPGTEFVKDLIIDVEIFYRTEGVEQKITKNGDFRVKKRPHEQYKKKQRVSLVFIAISYQNSKL